eukprot:281350_1
MSLNETQWKSIKQTNIQTKHIVFGFFKGTIPKLFGDTVSLNAFSLIQFICLRYYWQKTKYKYSQLKIPSISELPDVAKGCFSNNIKLQIKCTKQLRILLSQANNPPLKEAIDTGVVPRLIQFCYNKQDPELQYESLWALLNISSGAKECAQHLINNKAHNVFIELLTSLLYEIKLHALWGLGNIAGDSIELKDLLLNSNILPNILEICSSEYDETFVTNFNGLIVVDNDKLWLFVELLIRSSWAVGNLCRGSPPPKLEYLHDLVKCLQLLLKHVSKLNDKSLSHMYNDMMRKDEIIMNVAWAFYYLAEFNKYNTYLVDKLIEIGIIAQFVELMDHKCLNVRNPINRLIGDILTGSDEHTKLCLDFGVLSKYLFILNNLSPSTSEQKEICWSISNICGTKNGDGVLLVLKTKNLFEKIIEFLRSSDYKIAGEALWTIRNATAECDSDVINGLVRYGVINSLVTYLRRFENKFHQTKNEMLSVALEAIENILIVGDKTDKSTECYGEPNDFDRLFRECGMVTCLEDFMVDEDNINNIAFHKCCNIIDSYFSDECDQQEQLTVTQIIQQLDIRD